MIVLKNQKELKNQSKLINPALLESIKLDIDTIEENYEVINEKYGPMVIVLNKGEESKMLEEFPVIKNLDPEDPQTIHNDGKFKYIRTCYLMGDLGFAVYSVKEVSNV